jgi:hypothetical protein
VKLFDIRISRIPPSGTRIPAERLSVRKVHGRIAAKAITCVKHGYGCADIATDLVHHLAE